MNDRVCRCVLGCVLFFTACASSSAKPAPASPTAPPAGAASPPANAAAPLAGGKEALVLIKEIEAEPFREDDAFKAKMTVVMQWLTETPDITVILCAEMLPQADDARPHDGALFIQAMFGQAAYLLEHPGTQPKDAAAFTSGLVTAVRAYRKLQALHPNERSAAWDALDADERKDGLSTRVRNAMPACVKEK